MHLDPPAPQTQDLGPFGVRTVTLNGTCVDRIEHEHKTYDHGTVVISGQIEVTIGDGSPKVFGPGEWVYVPKATKHAVRRVTPSTVYQCVHLHRDFNGIVVESYVGNSQESV